MRRIEAVLFDLGNVLAFHDNALLFRRFAEAAKLPVEEAARRFDPALWQQVNLGAVDGEGLRLEVNRRLELNLSVDAFFALWNCHFTVNAKVLPYVEALAGQVKRLLLSNTNALHFDYLKPRLPILERFDGLLLSHELHLAKPDEAIFRAALDAAGTDAEATAYFDDLPEYVDAARRLGIRALLFGQTSEFPAQLQSLGLALDARVSPGR
jgi:putative hydrolase of the HAD superfamily